MVDFRLVTLKMTCNAEMPIFFDTVGQISWSKGL